MSSSSVFQDTSHLSSVLSEFLTEVDPKLLDEGWGFEAYVFS